MREYETVTRPATTYQHQTAVKCDLCEAIADGDDWADGEYRINETEIKVIIKQEEGSSYPEGGSGTAFEIDMCPNCFKNVLIPFLIEKGADIKEKEWDW